MVVKLEGEQTLLRFYLTSFVRWHYRPLHEAIVEAARRENMAGATVLRGIMGFGAGGVVLKERTWTLGNELPVIVEVVDTTERIDAFLEKVEPMIREGMVTLERARVISYRASGGAGEGGRST
jgi:hypothetical protein